MCFLFIRCYIKDGMESDLAMRNRRWTEYRDIFYINLFVCVSGKLCAMFIFYEMRSISRKRDNHKSTGKPTDITTSRQDFQIYRLTNPPEFATKKMRINQVNNERAEKKIKIIRQKYIILILKFYSSACMRTFIQDERPHTR